MDELNDLVKQISAKMKAWKTQLAPQIEELREVRLNWQRTEAVWSEEKIVEVLKIADEKNWIVISDECYERLVFDQENTISQKLANDNSLKTEIIDKRVNSKPQTNAKIRNVDGTIFATVTSDPYDVENKLLMAI